MTQLSTANNVFSTAAQLVTACESYLTAQRIGVYLAGLNTATTPYELIYSSDKSQQITPRPLLHVPHFGEPSPLRKLFHTNGCSPQTEAAQASRTGNLSSTYLRLQGIIDAALEKLDKMKDPSAEVPIAVRKLTDTEDGWWIAEQLLQAAVLLSSQNKDKLNIMKAASLFRHSCGDGYGRRTPYPVKPIFPRDTYQFVDAHALLMELAFAAVTNTDEAIADEAIADEAIADEEYQRQMVECAQDLSLAWLKPFLPNFTIPDPANNPVRLFAGLANNIPDPDDKSHTAFEKCYNAAQFLRESEKQHLKNKRPDSAAKDSHRRLLVLIKAVSHRISDKALLFDSLDVEQKLIEASRAIINSGRSSREVVDAAQQALKVADALILEAIITEDALT